jgi:hypothetical protein
MSDKRTKAQLLNQLTRIELIHSTFHAKVEKAIKTALDNNCSEAEEPVMEFCDAIGVKFPTIDVHLRIPYGTQIKNIDDGYDDIEFEIIEFETIEE